jgi:hypothetical protein
MNILYTSTIKNLSSRVIQKLLHVLYRDLVAHPFEWIHPAPNLILQLSGQQLGLYNFDICEKNNIGEVSRNNW